MAVRLPDAVLHGPPLFRVQPIMVGDAHEERGLGAGPPSEADSCFVRNAAALSRARGALAHCPRCSEKINGHRIRSSARSVRRVGRRVASGRRSSPATFRSGVLGSPYPESPRIGYRVPAFVSLNARLESRCPTIHSEKWDAFDYLTVAGVALFLGGLGSASFRATRHSALLLPAGLVFMATAAYGARRDGVASSRSDSRGEDRLNPSMSLGSVLRSTSAAIDCGVTDTMRRRQWVISLGAMRRLPFHPQ